ncbi:MAG: L-seryl-tRNA(Ser) seleniumtransferase [Solirubrobacteraceae bacterium]|jgi:L-seryl-tRNA(Ser) seleniumtransferase|nr:L-seryl-tRNA(Ser) seleniumtransferase [Solirubrobacteraceae bacterium]
MQDGDRLRELPSVERLASALDAPQALAVAAARAVVERRREELRAGASDDADLIARARHELEYARGASLRPVLNATGVIVHTNLGRAPLPAAAGEALARTAAGYANLEYDLVLGRRGSRQGHVEELLCELTGAQAALAVNNGAAAVLLAAAALAGDGREIVVSRGQLVEIGGSFRIPDVVAQSGARLREVGTTNRTRLADYEAAIGESTGAILRAHPSNFRTLGFTEEVDVEALCALGPPVIDDVGSGALATGVAALRDEPPVRRSVLAGAALVCFSGDKLLGGPQAGLLVGEAGAVAAARAHPLARAVRIGRLPLAALEATLRLYRDPERARREIPVLAMLEAGEEMLAGRAGRMCQAARAAGADAAVVRATARVGGGALPLLELEGPAVAVEPPDDGVDALAARLRAGDPPVVGRIAGGRLLLDPRTLTDPQAEAAGAAVGPALRATP